MMTPDLITPHIFEDAHPGIFCSRFPDAQSLFDYRTAGLVVLVAAVYSISFGLCEPRSWKKGLYKVRLQLQQ